MLTSSHADEEDHFRQRLDSINKEMQAIIERTAIERDRLYRNSAMGSLAWDMTDATPKEATEPAFLFHAPVFNTTTTIPAPSRRILDESDVRRIVADEMKAWKEAFEQRMADSIKGVNTTMSQRLAEMNKSHLELAESIKETTEVSTRGLGEMQNALDRIQRCAKIPIENLSREMEVHVKGITSEQNHLRDAVFALQNEARIEQQRGDRRVDELVRRHHDLVRNSLLELDSHVFGLRDELEQMVRAQARKTSEECDVIHQHVARLRGALEATNDTTTQWVTELRGLMEENISSRSEMRLCRRDINRLEMLLQCVTVGDRDAGAMSGARDGLLRGELDRTTVGVEVSSGEFMALKERVNLLQQRIEKMDRQMTVMDGALHRLFAAGGGGGSQGRDPAFGFQASHPGTMGGRMNYADPLDARYASMGTNPHPSQSLSPVSMRKHQQQQFLMQRNQQYCQQQKQMMAAHSPQEVSPKMGTNEDSPMGVREPTNLDLLTQSPSSALSRRAQWTNDDPSQQQQPMEAQQFPRYSHALSSPGVVRHAMENTEGPPAQSSDRLPVTQQTTRPDAPDSSKVTENYGDQGMSMHFIRGSRDFSQTPNPSDSYVSDDNEEAKKDEQSMQYVPAPSSDIESEIDNNKMARLALD
ncbi:hypothetical protein MOQ_004421 [Trypanosoma cruzi marinkellei]|uniref:Uncharacterized protein n=1 Tax=Trypanosoma cruzi marinkellei TaxID=85056 RepID=K2NRX1_TRYCR|nr:hypothetical protein MOQ_004421 [Trypanosoma cruzi marinkellei]